MFHVPAPRVRPVSVGHSHTSHAGPACIEHYPKPQADPASVVLHPSPPHARPASVGHSPTSHAGPVYIDPARPWTMASSFNVPSRNTWRVPCVGKKVGRIGLSRRKSILCQIFRPRAASQAGAFQCPQRVSMVQRNPWDHRVGSARYSTTLTTPTTVSAAVQSLISCEQIMRRYPANRRGLHSNKVSEVEQVRNCGGDLSNQDGKRESPQEMRFEEPTSLRLTRETSSDYLGENCEVIDVDNRSSKTMNYDPSGLRPARSGSNHIDDVPKRVFTPPANLLDWYPGVTAASSANVPVILRSTRENAVKQAAFWVQSWHPGLPQPEYPPEFGTWHTPILQHLLRKREEKQKEEQEENSSRSRSRSKSCSRD